MRAVDTNILARFIMQDDHRQAQLAEAILAEPFFTSDTVFLELGWLLSSRYRLDRRDLAATLHDVLSMPTITVNDPEALRWAVDRFAAGGDLADMIHIVASAPADCFVGFDRGVAESAGDTAPMPIETLV